MNTLGNTDAPSANTMASTVDASAEKIVTRHATDLAWAN